MLKMIYSRKKNQMNKLLVMIKPVYSNINLNLDWKAAVRVLLNRIPQEHVSTIKSNLKWRKWRLGFKPKNHMTKDSMLGLQRLALNQI